LSRPRFSPYLLEMSILRLSLLLFLTLGCLKPIKGQDELDRDLTRKPKAEEPVREAISSGDLIVVHLWAPWCPNCQAELKSGGWEKLVKDNPQVKFYFVSVWDDGKDGAAMLTKFGVGDQPNVTILADKGPRSGDTKIKQFAGMPFSWIPTTWVFKGGDLHYALNYGEVRFDVLQQFLKDSNSEWSHKGEPKLAE